MHRFPDAGSIGQKLQYAELDYLIDSKAASTDDGGKLCRTAVRLGAGDDMDVDNLIAIDTHTHLEVSCRNPFDSYGEEYRPRGRQVLPIEPAPDDGRNARPTTGERKVGFVNFTVDAETQTWPTAASERRDRRGAQWPTATS